ADAGSIEEERGVMESERGFGALIVVQRVATEPVAAAAGCEVVQRPLQPVAAEEPFECADRAGAVLGLTRDGEGAQLGLDERGRIERLLVAHARRRLASPTATVTREPECLRVEAALVAQPAQRVEAEPGEVGPVERTGAAEECLRQARVVVG